VPSGARVGYDRPDMTTCAKCGAENVAGDAFCGACGAFLEFAAEEAQDAEGVAEEVAEGAPAGDPAAPVSAAVPVPPEPSGPTCAACGRVNPAGRRFCISCGERLPAASSTATPGAGPETPPGARPAKPAWEFPTAPVPAAAVPVAPVAPTAYPWPSDMAAASSRGGSRLPLVAGGLVVLALLAGGAVLVLGSGFGGGTPGATAAPSTSPVAGSIAPSPEPSQVPTAAASATPTAQPPTPEPTPAVTIPPGPSVGIVITSAKASSQLKAERGPKFLFDGSPATTWKSASGKFQGAWVEVRFAPAAITRIQVWTGWQKSEPLFYGNHRPQNVTVSFDGGAPVPLELQDALGAQRIDIPPELGIVRATRVRITIADVYDARKTTAKDSPTKEVAISEIRLFGIPVTP